MRHFDGTHRVPAAREVSARAFKAACSELIETVARTRSELIVTKHGRPVVRMCPIDAAGSSPVGFLAGTIVGHGDIVPADVASWSESPTDPLAPRRNR
ncbi:MAG: type II toxin-antitoxin system Phd/YefM family antitoxin [Gemmatimonadaceae bacterium]|nr:type II toxin-antitoxin system Phd/YefM family antitoxin [Gemmatimonadaceae bacterium]